ncbi:MAG: hypothetical protein J5I47_11605 [Vicingus serpentipes]|nr:hypothetical protein [Vicingus serpentipes]
MYNGLLHAHSGLRWLLFLFLIIAIIKAFAGWLGKKEYQKADNIIALILLSFTHLMGVIGIVLYFISPNVKSMKEAMSDAFFRFWSMEHGLLMLFAIVLITVGRVKSKKATTDIIKHKTGAIFYTIAFIMILWGGVIQPIILKHSWF